MTRLTLRSILALTLAALLPLGCGDKEPAGDDSVPTDDSTVTDDTDDTDDTSVCQPERPAASASGTAAVGHAGGPPSEADGDTTAGQSSFNFDSNWPSDDPIAATRSGSTPPPHPRRHRRSDPTTCLLYTSPSPRD